MPPRKKKEPEFTTEFAPLEDLMPHPRNYREHPEDQLEHIKASLRDNGFYRPVVTARDLTILAGHGVVLAAKEMKLGDAPIRRLDLDPMDPRALKILAGDNEISRLAIVEDRILTDLLRDIQASIEEDALLGTGLDDEKLAALMFVTRPHSEVEKFDTAAEWEDAGMPEFTPATSTPRMVIQFREEADRDEFVEKFEIHINKKFTKHAPVWSAWWPARPYRDLASVQFMDESEEETGAA